MVTRERLNNVNPWWVFGREFTDSDITTYEQSFVKVKRRRFKFFANNIYLIKGPRRVGKTLYLKLLVKESADKTSPSNILYFSFEQPVSLKELENMLVEFLSKPGFGVKLIFLDEIQTIKDWQSVLWSLSDHGYFKNAVVFVTGSLAHLLDYEKLAGRGIEGNVKIMRQLSFNAFVKTMLEQMLEDKKFLETINLFFDFNFTEKVIEDFHIELEKTINPESFEEIQKKADKLINYLIPLNKMFDVYLHTGGYPKVINNYLSGKGKINNDLYAEIFNYVKSDAATLAGSSTGDQAKALKVIESITGNVGVKVSYSSIASKMYMNTETLITYFHRLENSYVFTTLEGVNSKLEARGVRKTYFSDVFIHYSALSAIIGKNGFAACEELLRSSSIGVIVEEVVANHLIRIMESDPMRTYNTFLKFYSERKEIDFVYKNNDSWIGVEVKYQNDVDAKDVNRIEKIKNYIILSKNTIARNDHALVLPVSVFLAMLGQSEDNL